ncbi:sensor histidine kinase [Roseivirga misakiensis]|uniref:Signal transduction histidine kinase internal region domain-containing protein n=1 Tax=Roseivirga misakiensis TaxID=1563681 RepID=A0A1E5T6C6_9BACT|nr:histidine kinase [Roseivirga misakiensis]OEK06931.1 hypothetical protein BFP71_04555 [Roseivirga misakiensis]
MNHPFIRNRNIIIYTGIWLVISILFAFGLFYFNDLEVKMAAIDSAIFNGIFYGLGLSYWFNVRYSSFDKSQLLNLIISHVAALVISVGLALFISNSILTRLAGEEEYLNFLRESLPWRGALGLMYYFIIILVYYLILYYDDVNEKNQERSQLETMLKSSELEMLKSQINPHFIFNSLNSIASLTIISPEKARDMVVKLSEFLRYSLGKENDQMNTMNDEITNIMLYLDIEKVRFGDRLSVETNIEKDCLALHLPNLILQPIFENTIKHGIYESLEQVTIKLKAWQEQNLLRIEVSNQFDPNAVGKKGKGIGLKNVTERLRLIYGVPQLVVTEKTDNLFTVRLDIPQIATDV